MSSVLGGETVREAAERARWRVIEKRRAAADAAAAAAEAEEARSQAHAHAQTRVARAPAGR